MPKMTPEREAAYALAFGVARSDLPEQAQLAYDRLIEQRAHAITPVPSAQGEATAASAGPLAGRIGAMAAAPMIVDPGQIRPRRRWYWLVLVPVLAIFAWVTVVLLLVDGTVNSFQRVPAQGTGEFSLRSGQYLIYYEAPPGPFIGPAPAGHVDMRPLSASGAVGSITGYSSSLTYSLGSHHGTAVLVVRIARPGRFLVRATSSPAVHGARLAIGPSINGWILVGVLPSLGLMLAGVAIVIVIALRRRNHRRAILAQPPWQTPAPESS
jgi:hypothetical protein